MSPALIPIDLWARTWQKFSRLTALLSTESLLGNLGNRRLGNSVQYTPSHAHFGSAIPSEKEFWIQVVRTVLTSRAMDRIEEEELLPEGKVLYQFSARGHDLAQALLGLRLNHAEDAATGYYRSRPLLLASGLSMEDAFAGPMGKAGGFSDGRDIGVVCNLPSLESTKILPMGGGVGSQYTPALGWAQALRYRHTVLHEDCAHAVSVALGGDGSTATNGFWAALNAATTQKLPMLFFIEDNAYGLSVPSSFQTPGGNIAANLASFQDLLLLDGDGTEPAEALQLIDQALTHIRSGEGPAMLRLQIPRLSGHSGQDTQAYKSDSFVADENARDPLPKLETYLHNEFVSQAEWETLSSEVETDVRAALEAAEARPEPNPETLRTHVFFEGQHATLGGVGARGKELSPGTETAETEGSRINMLTSIRRTLESELSNSERVVLFGEDIGPKGGVHGATLGLQEKFGDTRVFDTSLSEEAIIGRAIGMAYGGLVPIAEIQFRKYADPATEQLNDCGTTRWRTNNRFASPIVVRVPGGFSKCGDPWHSMSNEVAFAHAYGWQVLYPSNAADAVGLLRAAVRSHNPSFFFEHRNLLDAPSARRPYPGDDYTVEIGRGALTQMGSDITIVTWGAMLERCEEAARQLGEGIAEIIDLRSIVPWDKELVFDSVARTKRCLVVHEDNLTAGFGAEIAAEVASECHLLLQAPVDRLAVRDIPLPYNPTLLAAALPSVKQIHQLATTLLEY